MSARAILITLLGIACGFFAAIGVTQMSTQTRVVEKQEVPLTGIVMVKQAVDRGKALTSSSLELKPWPEELVPDGALKSLEEATGRIAISKLIAGEPLLEGRLAPPGTYRGAGNLIQPGMRAYTITTSDAAASVAGLILPGDRIDIILTSQSPGSDQTGGGTSTTLLQNVEILAIDKNLEAPDSPVSGNLTSATLLVTQRQASLLGLGQKAGTLTMALRNPEDEEAAITEPVTMAELRLREEMPVLAQLAGEADFEAEASDDSLMPQSTLGTLYQFFSRLRVSNDSLPSLAASAEIKTAATSVQRKPRFTSIRTLRGSQSGLVSIQFDRR